MHTTVRIVAAVDRSPRLYATGALALRLTDTDVVHLVSTAASPVGGDEVTCTIRVGPGATLLLTTVAATLVYPSHPNRKSHWHWDIDVAEGGAFTYRPLPTIVVSDASHQATARVRVAPGASCDLTEVVQLGRSVEPPNSNARYSSGLHVDRRAAVGACDPALLPADVSLPPDAVPPPTTVTEPLLRHRVDLGDPIWGSDRVYANRFRYPDAAPTLLPGDLGADLTTARSLPLTAGRLQLAAGPATLTTVQGQTFAKVTAALAALDSHGRATTT